MLGIISVVVFCSVFLVASLFSVYELIFKLPKENEDL